ncbi:MAG TPA: metal-dependent hydrolase [Campylobacterales bacterium]|nr:metal-dependent hydrolase [Campylobacterales bacterium]
MKIISADYILTMDKEFQILTDKAVAYDKKIIKIDTKENLVKKFPAAKLISCEKNSVLLPGLINTHVHLEYLTNKTKLEYGEFIKWLQSVIEHRQELIDGCSEDMIEEVLEELLRCGTTTIGEISSFGLDIEPCKKSKMNVVLFNEVLGSNPTSVDILYQDFLQRYQLSCSLEDERFIPAISVHSPYSTHPILVKKALLLAKDKSRVVSTHFMESHAEREWLDSGCGGFKEFSSSFTPNPKPMSSSFEFLELFKDVKTLFAHASYATNKELEYIEKNHYISHCPVSNRLLENKKLDIKDINNFTLATDGLTSNISLNLWDELRSALFIHENIEIDELSRKLLSSVTAKAGDSLGLNKGQIKEGYDSDLIVVNAIEDFDDINSLAKWLILHSNKSEKTIINGEEV